MDDLILRCFGYFGDPMSLGVGLEGHIGSGMSWNGIKTVVIDLCSCSGCFGEKGKGRLETRDSLGWVAPWGSGRDCTSVNIWVNEDDWNSISIDFLGDISADWIYHSRSPDKFMSRRHKSFCCKSRKRAGSVRGTWIQGFKMGDRPFRQSSAVCGRWRWSQPLPIYSQIAEDRLRIM